MSYLIFEYMQAHSEIGRKEGPNCADKLHIAGVWEMRESGSVKFFLTKITKLYIIVTNCYFCRSRCNHLFLIFQEEVQTVKNILMKIKKAAGRRKAAVSFLLALLMFASFALYSSQVSYAVSVNGEYIGSAEDKNDVIAVIDDLSDEVKGIDSEQNAITAQVTVSTVLGGNKLPIDVIKENILSNLCGVTECWYLTVDGTAVVRSVGRAELDDMLADILAEYPEDENNFSSFVQNAVVAYGLVGEDLTSDIESIKAALTPGSGSDIALDVKTVSVEETFSDIPYGSVSKDDDSLYPHQSGKVIAEGENGVLKTRIETVFINGEKVSRNSADTVVEEAVDKVTVNGTKEYVYGSTGTYIWPATGNLTSGFGPRSGGVGSSNHQGIDICGSYGQDIWAADGGTVIYAGWMSGYGNLVQIKHENGDVTYYAHNTSLNVSVGDEVYQGQVIAQMGSTGTSSANHCHFEVRVNGKAINPVSVLP